MPILNIGGDDLSLSIFTHPNQMSNPSGLSREQLQNIVRRSMATSSAANRTPAPAAASQVGTPATPGQNYQVGGVPTVQWPAAPATGQYPVPTLRGPPVQNPPTMQQQFRQPSQRLATLAEPNPYEQFVPPTLAATPLRRSSPPPLQSQVQAAAAPATPPRSRFAQSFYQQEQLPAWEMETTINFNQRLDEVFRRIDVLRDQQRALTERRRQLEEEEDRIDSELRELDEERNLLTLQLEALVSPQGSPQTSQYGTSTATFYPRSPSPTFATPPRTTYTQNLPSTRGESASRMQESRTLREEQDLAYQQALEEQQRIESLRSTQFTPQTSTTQQPRSTLTTSTTFAPPSYSPAFAAAPMPAMAAAPLITPSLLAAQLQERVIIGEPSPLAKGNFMLRIRTTNGARHVIPIDPSLQYGQVIQYVQQLEGKPVQLVHPDPSVQFKPNSWDTVSQVLDARTLYNTAEVGQEE